VFLRYSLKIQSRAYKITWLALTTGVKKAVFPSHPSHIRHTIGNFSWLIIYIVILSFTFLHLLHHAISIVPPEAFLNLDVIFHPIY